MLYQAGTHRELLYSRLETTIWYVRANGHDSIPIGIQKPTFGRTHKVPYAGDSPGSSEPEAKKSNRMPSPSPLSLLIFARMQV